jgi:porin
MKSYLPLIMLFFLMNSVIFTQYHFAQSSNLVDSKLFPFQNKLLSYGIDLNATLIADYYSKLSGGIQNGYSFVDNIILDVSVDANQLTKINGLKLYISSLTISGGPFIENTGAIQGIGNISGMNQWKVYEAWVQQDIIDNEMSVLFGLYDLNSEFDFRESSGIFNNPSFGIGYDFAQSGEHGPSIFPHTSLALRFKFKASKSIELMTAVFDGVPGSLANEKEFEVKWNKEEGVLISTEVIITPAAEEYGKDYSKISIGSWYYTSNFENVSNGKKENGNFGVYISSEQFILAEESSYQQGLALFGRLGFAHSNFNISDYSILGGSNYIGLIPDRDEDIFGLAFRSIHLTDQFTSSEYLKSKFETIIELTYSLKLTNWMKVQPDLQYIFNPVFASKSDYAFTAGLRAEIGF